MIRLIFFLVVPYLAIASVATGAVDGLGALDAARDFVSDVQQQSDEVATAIIDGPADLDHKVTVCHLPDSDPAKAQLVSVAMDAWPAHEAHGDYKLSSSELLTEPLLSRCAASTEITEDQHPSSNGNPADHANAGNGGAPEHSQAGGNVQGKGANGE